MQEIPRENLRVPLAAFIEKNALTPRRVAKAIGCSEATINRLLSRDTLPTDEMMQQVGLMIDAGFDSYAAMTKAQKSKFSKNMPAAGAVGGGIVGFAVIGTAVEGLGAVAGASAAGISSGLFAMGSAVGGGMLLGVSVAAAIPVAAGVVGYGVVKGAGHLVSETKLNAGDVSPRWEISNESAEPKT